MWYAKNTNGYNTDTVEAKANATEIYNILYNLGYTVNSICAILGNIYKESNYNPWQWEGNQIKSSSNYRNYSRVGYGLVQWTPSYEYIDSTVAQSYSGYAPNFSDIAGSPDDGAAQTNFINYQLFNGGNYFWNQSRYNYYNYPQDDNWNPPMHWPSTNPPYFYYITGKDTNDFTGISANDFKTDSSISIADLCGAFNLKYLRPHWYYAARDYNKSVTTANWWYDYFSGSPTPPTPPPPVPPTPVPDTIHHMPVWMMIKYY